MFAPLVLPFQLTLLIVIVSVVAASAILPRYGCSARIAVGYSLVAAVALFVPSCIGVGFLVDLVRYGMSSYTAASEIPDPYIQIPESATDIVVFKWASGHDARFKVSHDDMRRWLENHHMQRDNAATETLRQSFPERFSSRTWVLHEDTECYLGPRSERGAGFDIWYSPKHGVAYLAASYW